MKRIARILFLLLLPLLCGCLSRASEPSASVAAAPSPAPAATATPSPSPTALPTPTPSPTPDPRVPKIENLSSQAGVISLAVSGGVPPYRCCFVLSAAAPAPDSPDWIPFSGSAASVFQTDGRYRAFVIDSHGALSEGVPTESVTGYRMPLSGEGVKALSKPLSDLLAENGDSVSAFNARIAANAAAAGRYTRAGVAASALSLVSDLAGYGAAMRYQAKGSFQKEDDFGVNPDWGRKLKKPVTDPNGTYYHTGMQCVASVVWAYRQAGINLVNAGSGTNIGEAGSKIRRGDNRIPFECGQCGDVIKHNGHYFLILDRLDSDADGRDDAYLCYEMVSPSLVLSVYALTDERNRILYDMSAVFENAGLFREKARYWEDTFFIPENVLDDMLYGDG